MKKSLIYLFLICSILSYSTAYAQDRKADAQKLYLHANSLIQLENYQAAKSVLEKIIIMYEDLTIASEADKKLSEIIPKMTLSPILKTPGVYAKLKSSELIKLEKEPIFTGNLINYGATYLNDLLYAPEVKYILYTVYKELAADEIESFIVVLQNKPSAPPVDMCYAKAMKIGIRRWSNEAEASKGKPKFVLLSHWSDDATNRKTILSDEIIKNKLAENIYELKLLEGLVPTYSLYVINDGFGNAYPLLLKEPKAKVKTKSNKKK